MALLLPNHGVKEDGVDAVEVDVMEVDGEVGDVNVVQPMILLILKLKLKFQKEVPNLGDMADGEVGDVSVAP